MFQRHCSKCGTPFLEISGGPYKNCPTCGGRLTFLPGTRKHWFIITLVLIIVIAIIYILFLKKEVTELPLVKNVNEEKILKEIPKINESSGDMLERELKKREMERRAIEKKIESKQDGQKIYSKKNSLSNSETPIELNGNLKPPKLIQSVTLSYPQVALLAGVEGSVKLDVIIDINGKVRSIKVIEGHPLLNDSAIYSIKQQVYEPYILNGVPREVMLHLTLNYKLPSKEK